MGKLRCPHEARRVAGCQPIEDPHTAPSEVCAMEETGGRSGHADGVRGQVRTNVDPSRAGVTRSEAVDPNAGSA